MKSENYIGYSYPTRKGVITVTGIIGSNKSKNKIFSIECSVCSKDKELFKEPFKCLSRDIDKQIIPCGCSKSPKWNQYQYDILMKRHCKSNNMSFHGFHGEFTNCKHTKCICSCNKCNHQWNTGSLDNILNQGKGCPKCGGSLPITEIDATSKILSICKEHNYDFLGFVGDFKNSNSKLKYFCKHHGQQTVSYLKFVNGGNRCPSCSISGYDKSKPGWFYIFKYKKVGFDSVYKFGITNRTPQERSSEHIRGIDDIEISEMVLSKLYTDGKIPFLIEKEIKKRYKTKIGICDWLTSGNTETF